MPETGEGAGQQAKTKILVSGDVVEQIQQPWSQRASGVEIAIRRDEVSVATRPRASQGKRPSSTEKERKGKKSRGQQPGEQARREKRRGKEKEARARKSPSRSRGDDGKSSSQPVAGTQPRNAEREGGQVGVQVVGEQMGKLTRQAPSHGPPYS